MAIQPDLSLGESNVLRCHVRPSGMDSLLSFCKNASINHIMLFTGADFDLYARPHSPEEARQWVEEMKPLVSRLRDEGIRVSINIWYTFGHGDVGVKVADSGGYQAQVGDDGALLCDTVCPLDQRFRLRLRECFASYAQLHPDTLWIDDDFRWHNHQPASWTCFCPLHLKELKRQLGFEPDRKEVVAALLADRANQNARHIRNAWYSLQNSILVELIEEWSDILRVISPQTGMGLMTSPPEVHAVEGRDWGRLIRTLSATGAATIRPTLGCYSGLDPRDVITGLQLTLRTSAICRKSGVKVNILPEIENYPYGRWNKSVRLTRLQIGACAACGIVGLTLDLHRYTESSFDTDREMMTALREMKVWQQTLQSLLSPGDVMRGVGIALGNAASIGGGETVTTLSDLIIRRPFDSTLALLGIGVTYAERESVVVLEDRVVEELSHGMLESVLRGGVLMDATAAHALQTKGYSNWIGTEIWDVLGDPQEEVNVDAGLARIEESMRDTRLDRPLLYEMRPRDGARAGSEILGASRRRLGPGIILYENSFGGRVAVLADDSRRGGLMKMSFRNSQRQTHLMQVLTWLSRGRLPILLRNAPDAVPIRIDLEKSGLLLSVINAGLDRLVTLDFEVGDVTGTVMSVKRLSEQGWVDVQYFAQMRPDGFLSLTLRTTVDYIDVAIFRVSLA